MRTGSVKFEKLVASLPGVETVLAGDEKRAHGLDQPRSGELSV
jgi:hypothetical protein